MTHPHTDRSLTQTIQWSSAEPAIRTVSVNSRLGSTGVCILFVLGTLAACGGDGSDGNGGGNGSAAAPTPSNPAAAPPPSNGGGAVGGATSKAWGTAALIDTDNGNACCPQIAIDADGNALAVWDQFDGTRRNIWSNRYTADTGWGTAALIETDNADDAYRPQIAIDANGNALAVWQQWDGTRDNIWSNRYTAGTGWGTAALIETDNAGYARYPQIAIDVNGNALAVWSQFDATSINIWSNRYTIGTGWGTAALIETDNGGSACCPQIAIDANGNALAVWWQSDVTSINGTRADIWSNRYTAGTGWGTAALIETDNTGTAVSPRIALNANGNALVVWQQPGAIWSNRYAAGTGWGTAALIETDVGNAYNPQIAIDTNGNALAVWWGSGTLLNIWSNRYAAGTGWGTAALIETDSTGIFHNPPTSPEIAIDAKGDALVVWCRPGGGGTGTANIWSNRYTAGTGWGTAALIETDNGSASDPQIAVDANGNALAIWQQWDGTRNSIWANRFH